MTPPARSPGPLRALAYGLAMTLVAALLQWTLRPFMGDKVPFLFFLPAIGVTAMWWGWRPALPVMAGGLLHAAYWFEPVGLAEIRVPTDAVALVAFLFSGSVLLGLGARVNAMRRRAMQAEARLGEQLRALRALNEQDGRQRERLRQADRRKDEFLATLAHELRNPLAPIRQAAMIARSDAATDAQKRRSHDIIERQVRHMALLLDDLLDVSRITRGKLDLRREPTPLSVVVEATVETSRPLLDARGQQLRVELPTPDLWLDADPLRVEQILSNLLGNAAKYGKPGGEVVLSAARHEGTAVVRVQDDGVGIPAESLDAVFEMFAQLPRAGLGPGGLGIGLALSRGLAQLHGGHLVAQSDGPAQGSTFVLTLPLATQLTSTSAPVPLQAPARAPGSCRVLVADDNRDAAETLAEMLRLHGHEVVLAYDGTQALQLFRETRPQAALLDIGMPGLSGNEVAQAIRSLPSGGNALLVAVTGWGQERDRAASRLAGFDQHLTKPVDPLQVLGLLSGSASRGGGDA